MASIPIYSSTSIRLTALISELSFSSSLPSSFKVRNRLLSPWTIPPLPSSATTVLQSSNHDSDFTSLLVSSTEVESDPWSAFFKHQPGLEVFIFGNPPPAVLNEPQPNKQESSHSELNKSGLWAVLIYALPMPMPDRSSGPRIDLWISSQSTLRSRSLEQSASSSDSPNTEVIASEKQLLERMVKGWLAEKLKQNQIEDEKNGKDEDPTPEGSFFVLCGIEQRLCDLVESWCTQDEGKGKILTKEWSGSYVAYAKECSQRELNEMIRDDYRPEGEANPKLIDGRWKVERIREKEIDLVQSTNKIPFPRDYVSSHLSHSVLLRDMAPSKTSFQTGAAAGWCYNHDDLALASLHVPQAYRRLNQGKGKGIGTIVMNLMAPRIALMQRYGLKKAGITELLERKTDGYLTPCLSVTEVGNVGPRALFSKCGFVEEDKVAWIGLRMKI